MKKTIFLLIVLAFLFQMNSYATLVGYWDFNEGSGTSITDQSGSGNDGTLYREQANTWSTGRIGSGLYFDGSTGAYVSVPTSSSLEMTGQISFAAWVKPTNPNRDAPIIAKEGGNLLSYWFGVHYNKFGVLLSNNSGGSWAVNDRAQGTITANEWSFLVCTWDGSTIRHYLNGQLVGTTSFTGSLYVSSAFLSIGINSLFDGTRFEGYIDEVRIYDNALTQTEVLNLMAVPEPSTIFLLFCGLMMILWGRKKK